MSELDLEREDSIRDDYSEHELHCAYDKNCSTCFSENRLIAAHNIVNSKSTSERNYDALNPRDGSTPWDKSRLN